MWPLLYAASAPYMASKVADALSAIPDLARRYPGTPGYTPPAPPAPTVPPWAQRGVMPSPAPFPAPGAGTLFPQDAAAPAATPAQAVDQRSGAMAPGGIPDWLKTFAGMRPANSEAPPGPPQDIRPPAQTAPEPEGYYGGSPETNPNLRPIGSPQPWQGSPFAGFLDAMYDRGRNNDAGLIPKFVNLIGRSFS